MSGFTTRERRPFVIDTESPFSRNQRRPKTGVSKKNKTSPKRHNGIIHVGHGNRTPPGSPVWPSERDYAWPWSDTEDAKDKSQIDEASVRRFWSVNTRQNQCTPTSTSPCTTTALTSGQISKVHRKHEHRSVEAVVFRPTSGENISKVPLSFNESYSAKTDSVKTSVSKETLESGVTNKTDVKLSSCASTLQVFEKVHNGKLSNFVCDLYGHDRLTDIKIHVGSYGFNAHRVVLACFSPYFANILLNSDKLGEYVLAKNITPTGFKKVLDYMYTEELTIEVENVAEILQAAEVLQINELQEQCYTIFKGAEPLALLDILETSHKQGVRYVCENIILSKLSRLFHEVCKMDEILQLCCQCLGLLLSRDDLVVESEYIVAMTAVKWICYGSDERLKVLEDVFSFIRFENMTSNELLQLGQEASFLMENKSIAAQIMKVHWSRRSIELGMVNRFSTGSQQPRNYKAKEIDSQGTNKEKDGKCAHTDKAKSEKVSANNNNSKNKRKPSKYVENMLQDHCITWHMPNLEYDSKKAEGCPKNLDDDSRGTLKIHVLQKDVFLNREKHNTNYDQSISVNTLVRNQKVIRIDDSAYLIGGTICQATDDTIELPTNKVIKVDLKTSEYCDWFPMWEPRNLHGVTSVGNVIFVIGGVSHEGHCLSSIESLEHGHTKYGWKRECEMPSPRSGAAVTSIDEKIYIAGGSPNPKNLIHIMDSVLEYNTKAKQFTEIHCLRIPRFGATMVSHNKRLYVIGGITCESDGNVSSADMDVWDGRRWMKRARLQNPRYNCSVSVFNSCIAILGGHGDMKRTEETVTQSEIFNIDRKVWEIAPLLDENNDHNLHILL